MYLHRGLGVGSDRLRETWKKCLLVAGAAGLVATDLRAAVQHMSRTAKVLTVATAAKFPADKFGR